MILLWGWLACGGATTPQVSKDTPSSTDTGATSTEVTSTSTTSTPSSSTPDTNAFWGVVIDPPLPAPSFSVLNQLGEPRTETWLEQGPTVLWFYRDAGTAG